MGRVTMNKQKAFKKLEHFLLELRTERKRQVRDNMPKDRAQQEVQPFDDALRNLEILKPEVAETVKLWEEVTP
jgi:hypothetical protein